jgi:pimeloyl-ACP methyl ester carboxylesterase
MSKSTSSFVSVNGLELYCKTQGTGVPLLLLHGGVMPDCFAGNADILAKGRRVISVHLQGHGHTRDIDRPLRFESMADDLARLVERLDLAEADVLGYSMGGGVALQMAIRHPGSVRRLVVVSQPMHHSAWFPEVQGAYEQMAVHAPQIARNIQGSPIGTMYPEVDWERLLRKIGDLESRSFDWRDGVAAIKAPTMLVFADADAIQVEHMAEFYKALGGGRRDAGLDGSLRASARLAIVPGATHYDVASKPSLAEMAAAFLDTTA